MFAGESVKCFAAPGSSGCFTKHWWSLQFTIWPIWGVGGRDFKLKNAVRGKQVDGAPKKLNQPTCCNSTQPPLRCTSVKSSTATWCWPNLRPSENSPAQFVWLNPSVFRGVIKVVFVSFGHNHLRLLPSFLFLIALAPFHNDQHGKKKKWMKKNCWRQLRQRLSDDDVSHSCAFSVSWKEREQRPGPAHSKTQPEWQTTDAKKLLLHPCPRLGWKDLGFFSEETGHHKRDRRVDKTLLFHAFQGRGKGRPRRRSCAKKKRMTVEVGWRLG